MARESQFSDKQNFTAHQNKDAHSQYRSPEQLTVHTLITKKGLMCSIIYILKQAAQHLLVCNNAPAHIRRHSPKAKEARTVEMSDDICYST